MDHQCRGRSFASCSLHWRKCAVGCILRPARLSSSWRHGSCFCWSRKMPEVGSSRRRDCWRPSCRRILFRFCWGCWDSTGWCGRCRGGRGLCRCAGMNKIWRCGWLISCSGKFGLYFLNKIKVELKTNAKIESRYITQKYADKTKTIIRVI